MANTIRIETQRRQKSTRKKEAVDKREENYHSDILARTEQIRRAKRETSKSEKAKHQNTQRETDGGREGARAHTRHDSCRRPLPFVRFGLFALERAKGRPKYGEEKTRPIRHRTLKAGVHGKQTNTMTHPHGGDSLVSTAGRVFHLPARRYCRLRPRPTPIPVASTAVMRSGDRGKSNE